jgi:hypothetical protein
MDRRKPKRLRSNSGDRHLGSYEMDAARFILDLNTRPIRRSVPAVSTWLATAPQRRKIPTEEDENLQRENDAEDRTGSKMPLLQILFEDLKRHKSHDANASEPVDGDGDQDPNIDKDTASPLDQYSTVLTHGHHKRFRELLAMFGSQNTSTASNGNVQRLRKKEFKSICDLFRQERKLYSEALREFWNANSERFNLGFKTQCAASQFISIKSQYIDAYKNVWLQSSRAMKYGSCIQTVSICHGKSRAGDSNGIAQITTETYSPRVVFRKAAGGDLPVLSMNDVKEVLKEGSQVQAIKNVRLLSSEELLSEDRDAKRLAIEYDAQIVLTDQVIESLLKSNNWILPICHQELHSDGKRQVAVFIDKPLPSSSLSRDCLSFGMIKSLYSHISRSQVPAENLHKEFIYTVLKIVRFGTSFNILVRTECFALNESKGPLFLDASLEYFPDRGMELIPVGSRAYWLMQKNLHSDGRQVLVRTDPETGKILKVEEKGVADAISSQDQTVQERKINSLHDFESVEETTTDTLIESMMDIFFASTKIAQDCKKIYVICYPGRNDVGMAAAASMVASVHKESTQICCVDLEQEFDGSRQVFLQPSFRNWAWDHERANYTFPYRGELITSSK